MALVRGSVEEMERLRTLLTLISTGRKQTVLHLYEDTGNKNTLLVPRSMGMGKWNLPVEHWENVPMKSIETNIVLRDYQKKLLDDYEKSLSGFPYGGIIKATTGSGKTVMGVELIKRFGTPALIITPTDLIMRQWIDQVKTFSNVKEVGIIRQQKADIKEVTVAMIHTLSKERHRYLENTFRQVIYDEIHTLGAETFSRTAGMFNCKLRTGLSATPRRKDGMAKVFEYHIGPVLAQYSNVMVEPKVIRIEYYNPATHHSGCVWDGELNLGSYVNKIVKCEHRNEMLLKVIKDVYKKGHNILFLSDRIAHLEWFYGRLQGLDVGFITGSKKETEAKIKVATYGSAGMGMDIPALTCIIFGTPRVDIEQPVGRVLRKANKLAPIVIDPIDTASDIIRGWGRVRERYYRKVTSNIRTMEVSV